MPDLLHGGRLSGFLRVAAHLLGAWGWLALWGLYYEQASCILALGFLVPIVFFTMLGMTENALLRRRATLSMYLRRQSGLFRLLRGGVLMLAWQTSKALFFGVLLFIAATAWGGDVWLLLGLDAILLSVVYPIMVRAIASQARPGYQDMLTRRLLTPLNALAALLAILFAEFNGPHPDLRDLTLVQAVQVQVEQVHAACDGVGILARAGVALDTMGWWLAETQLTRPELLAVAPVVWVGFLAASLTFLWAYSRLLLGMLVSPSGLRDLLTRKIDAEAAK